MNTDKTITDGSDLTETARVARRSTLGVVGGTIASATLFGVSGAAASPPKPEVRIENQESDGTSITVAYAATDRDAFVVIGRNGFGDIVGEPSTRLNLDAGDVVENVRLEPDDGPLSEGNHQLTARLQESNGGKLDTDEATVRVDDPPAVTSGVETQLVDADPGFGFNYPYYLYAPDRVESDPETPLLIEPNNTGTATDDFDQHLQRARDRAEGGAGRLAGDLGAPLVVPVFPRPREEPVDGTHYVHQLDETTLGIDSGPLQRVDLQLLRMAAHAREKLTAEGYPVDDRIMLNGFSASGNFADRFAVLHPEEVVSVTAGGLNGMAVLPVAERDGRKLPYHVGVSDIEELTGEPFDPDALDEVNQFLYMGAEDTNDTIPFDDAWTDDELRELALDIYGDDMITERFPTCQAAYREAGIDATFRVYEDAGHTPRPAMDDIVEFHRRSINGEAVSEMGDTIVPTVTFTVDTAEDGSIEFDASRSDGGVTEISRFLWAFGDGVTAVGETVTHEFEETGEYTVRLTVVLDDGNEYDAAKTLSVDQAGDVAVLDDGTDVAVSDEEASNPSDADAENDDAVSAPTDDGDIDDRVPGFGVGSALTGIGSAAYLLKRRLTDNETEPP